MWFVCVSVCVRARACVRRKYRQKDKTTPVIPVSQGMRIARTHLFLSAVSCLFIELLCHLIRLYWSISSGGTTLLYPTHLHSYLYLLDHLVPLTNTVVKNVLNIIAVWLPYFLVPTDIKNILIKKIQFRICT